MLAIQIFMQDYSRINICVVRIFEENQLKTQAHCLLSHSIETVEVNKVFTGKQMHNWSSLRVQGINDTINAFSMLRLNIYSTYQIDEKISSRISLTN